MTPACPRSLQTGESGSKMSLIVPLSDMVRARKHQGAGTRVRISQPPLGAEMAGSTNLRGDPNTSRLVSPSDTSSTKPLVLDPSQRRFSRARIARADYRVAHGVVVQVEHVGHDTLPRPDPVTEGWWPPSLSRGRQPGGACSPSSYTRAKGRRWLSDGFEASRKFQTLCLDSVDRRGPRLRGKGGSGGCEGDR